MIESTEAGTVVTGKHIELYRLLALRGALRLEIAGMRRRGRSVASILKQEFGFKGNRQSMLSQLQQKIEEFEA